MIKQLFQYLGASWILGVILIFFGGHGDDAFAQFTLQATRHGAGEEHAILRRDIQKTLLQFQHLIDPFPLEARQRIQKKILHLLSALHHQTLALSATQLMMFLGAQLQQAHQIQIRSSQWNSIPVDFISVGYLAFYYLAKNGVTAALWNKKYQAWQAIPSDEARHIRALLRMKTHQQPYNWVNLPLSSDNIDKKNI